MALIRDETDAMDGVLIKFEVPGKPGAKGRPRFFNRGKDVQTYTDKNTVSYENLIKQYFTLDRPGWIPVEYDLKLNVTAFFPVPDSYSNKKKMKCLTGELRPSKIPDVDNIAKIIMDALNKIAYKDDKQIVSLSVEKYYSERPRVDIVISGIKNEILKS